MSSQPKLAHLGARSLVRVAGPDWRNFLQGLITQDVETLAPGELRYAALLTPQGRLLYDLFVLGTADGVLLDVQSAQRQALVQRLNLYRLRAGAVTVHVSRPPPKATTTPIGSRSAFQTRPRTARTTRPIPSKPTSTF